MLVDFVLLRKELCQEDFFNELSVNIEVNLPVYFVYLFSSVCDMIR